VRNQLTDGGKIFKKIKNKIKKEAYLAVQVICLNRAGRALMIKHSISNGATSGMLIISV
jgi:hypothetical protein